MTVVSRLDAFKEYYVHIQMGPHQIKTATRDEDSLAWCLQSLDNLKPTGLTVQHDMLFSALEECVHDDKRSGSMRVEQELLDEVSDHATMWQLLRAVYLRRPFVKLITQGEATKIGRTPQWERMRCVPSASP